MRLAPEEKSFELTGYKSGGVTPIGLSNPKLPIILSKSITQLNPPLLYLGSGHRDWKVAFPINEFLQATKIFICDIETEN
jgi:prolyl-tRNA editing enzyme YbaK/EbsC (Cys-tRNA(Pro) deacylase)